MTQSTTKLTILFADISGSTALYEKLGNERALQLVTRTLAMLVDKSSAHHGTLLKTFGDEIMCIFPDVISAINAACAMQTAIDKQRPGGDQPMHVRIGLHYGEVIQTDNDVFGDAVNVAARVTAITRARQIMTTQDVIDQLPEKMRQKTRPVVRAQLKGKEQTFDIFQVIWENENVNSTRIGMSVFRKPAEMRHELMLRYRQQVATLNEQNKSLTLGRSEACDMAIFNNLASRQHARIEYSFGKFLLTDFSANGTYVRFSDNQEILLSQQQIVLHGSGALSLGQSFADNPGEIIEFLVQ